MNKAKPSGQRDKPHTLTVPAIIGAMEKYYCTNTTCPTPRKAIADAITYAAQSRGHERPLYCGPNCRAAQTKRNTRARSYVPAYESVFIYKGEEHRTTLTVAQLRQIKRRFPNGPPASGPRAYDDPTPTYAEVGEEFGIGKQLVERIVNATKMTALKKKVA